jgi:hypothetical protein
VLVLLIASIACAGSVPARGNPVCTVETARQVGRLNRITNPLYFMVHRQRSTDAEVARFLAEHEAALVDDTLIPTCAREVAARMRALAVAKFDPRAAQMAQEQRAMEEQLKVQLGTHGIPYTARPQQASESDALFMAAQELDWLAAASPQLAAGPRDLYRTRRSELVQMQYLSAMTLEMLLVQPDPIFGNLGVPGMDEFINSMRAVEEQLGVATERLIVELSQAP